MSTPSSSVGDSFCLNSREMYTCKCLTKSVLIKTRLESQTLEVGTMAHYGEKLMGVVVFAKVQGPKGSADFQTLQVRGPL